ncbi:MAG: ChbG/HpnK family deacetylase [Sphingobacteriales bacterium]
MTRIYLHADDAGVSRNATRRIAECWENGFIDGYSIIANEECYDIISDSLNKFPGKRANLSVHLNLTDGNCLNQKSLNSLIASPNGRFKLTFLKAFLMIFKGNKTRKKFTEEVFNEWDQQIYSIKKVLGKREIDALDSHNHVHMLPCLFEIIIKLSEKHGVKKTRFAREILVANNVMDIFKPFFWKNTLKWFVINSLYLHIRNKNYAINPKAAYITGILYSGRMSPNNVKKAIAKINRIGGASVEVVYHPGRALPDEMTDWALSNRAKDFFTREWRDREYETAKIIKNECGSYFENN